MVLEHIHRKMGVTISFISTHVDIPRDGGIHSEMNHEVLIHPNDFLRKRIKEVDITSIDKEELQTIKTTMGEIMARYNGVGLSASQIGMNKRIFVLQNQHKVSMFINPQIVDTSEETAADIEGCLSLPDIYLLVSRPIRASVVYYDENLIKHRAKIGGFYLRKFLHEFDHLNGVLIIDKSQIRSVDMVTTGK